jgi:methylase of polypeptide subunit release factors
MPLDETSPPLDTIVATEPQVVEFGDLRIAFDSRVLRPREWTLQQARWGAELLRTLPEGPVLELCAGAGHIGLATVQGTGRRLVCVEADAVAAAYASANALAAGLPDLVEIRERPMMSALRDDERFALVLADPPYLRSADTGQYPEDPLTAVDGGPDGLDLVRECLHVAGRHVLPGGTVLLQLRDRRQAEEVGELAGRSLRPVEVATYGGRGVVLRLDPIGLR